MSGIFAFNLACVIWLPVAFFGQWLLWNFFNEKVAELLKSITGCPLCKTLTSDSQKFPVFLAQCRAESWDSFMKQFGKILVFPALLVAGVGLLFKLVQVGFKVDFQTFLNEPIWPLYVALAIQIICLVILSHISICMYRFKKLFP